MLINNNAFAKESPQKPNILFISIDDLNDMIPALKPHAITQTPNLDKLFNKSTLFTKAYSNSTQCNPSRFSLLTGRLPSSTGVYTNISNSLLVADENENLFEYFRKNGYKTIGIGKLFHGTQNQIDVWDEYFTHTKNQKATVKSHRDYPINWAETDPKFFDMRDQIHSEKAMDYLSTEFEQPTLLALGFHSPHMPWFFLKKHFDKFHYPLNQIKKPVEPEYDLDDVPKIGKEFARQSSPGAPGFYHEAVVKNKEWKKAMQAYMVGISYMDARLGEVLDAFEKGPNNGNTMIVLWSDHGYHLGEKQHWNKHALWEKTTHVPLSVTLPKNSNKQKKQRVNKIVSLLDVFPTMLDLAGLKRPGYLEGRSLKPLIEDPSIEWNNTIITTMGYKNHSIRTRRWRYTHYKDGGEELYDKKFDPREFYNIEASKTIAFLKKEFKKILPKGNAKAVKNVGYR